MASGNRPSLKTISIHGPNHNHYGYGNMNLSLQKHLPPSVTLHPHSEVAVFCLQPSMIKGWFKGQKLALFTMWETSELPPHFYEYLPQFDKIIVPCEHNKELFSKYHEDVSVCHLGIDQNIWTLCEPPTNDVFRFVAGGSSWQRKGLDIVVRAFEKLNLKDAELVLKITPEIRGEPPKITNPNIKVVDTWMTVSQEYELYSTADCFVAASRGEGFGLMPLQNIAMGVPTIMSDMTGHSDFIELATTAVPAPPRPAVHPRLWNVGDWYETDFEALCEAMRDHYENRGKYRQKALQKVSGVSRFTWNKSAQKLVKLVGVGGTLTELDWVPGDQAQVQITASRKVEADIGRHRVRLAKGETALVPIVVRDTLRDAGYLEV